MAGYFDWQRALFEDEGLRAEAAKARRTSGGGVDIRMVALVIASFGKSGREAFAASATVADRIGCERHTVERYRKRLIELGWLAEAASRAGATGRGKVVDISIPLRPGERLCAALQCRRQGRIALPDQPYCDGHGGAP